MAELMTPSEFLNFIVEEVSNHRKTSKVKPDFFDSVSIAQACLEPGYGTSDLYLAFNNAFGYKAKKGEWSGKVAGDYKSDEHINGVKVKDVPSDFRAYDSVADSVKDHANMMTSRGASYIKVYDKAINAKTPQEQAHALTNTYATDPKYGDKLIEIMDAYDLYKYDKEESGKMAYIQLDVGHGSDTWRNGGGKGVSTGGKVYEEHSFNSIVGIKLKALLEKAGHKVKVTYGPQQPNSPEKSLSSRSSFANSNKVDLFVSIHANWVGTFMNSTNGIAVFYDGYISGSQRLIKSKNLAQKMMKRFKAQGQAIYTGGMGDGAGSIPSYSGSWTDFHVNRVTQMPSVLAELGFMSGNRDFDKIFGSQQATYTDQMAQGMADAINEYFGIEVEPVDITNPQGMKTSPMKPYKEPEQPFTANKVGDKVTLAVNFQWADLPKTELLRSFRYDELVGSTDEIVEVKNISDMPNRNHSNLAYKLKGYNSWILEEYLVEAKRDWKDGIVDVPEEELPEYVDNKEYDIYEFEKGYVAILKTEPGKPVKDKPEEPNE